MKLTTARSTSFRLVLALAAFIVLLHSARADTLRRIGYLTPDDEAGAFHYMAAFRQQLVKLGYSENKNFVLHVRHANYDSAALPRLARELVAQNVEVIVADSTPAVRAVMQAQQLEVAAKQLGLQIERFSYRGPGELRNLPSSLAKRVGALYITDDAALDNHRDVVGAFAIKHRIATICSYRLPDESTCLMWYGPMLLEQFRQTADYVHRILNGAKVAELPVQQPSKFAFIVNAATAKALRLKIPQSFLLSADEITK